MRIIINTDESQTSHPQIAREIEINVSSDLTADDWVHLFRSLMFLMTFSPSLISEALPTAEELDEITEEMLENYRSELEESGVLKLVQSNSER